MDDSIQSPLINGKPAWHVRLMRLYIIYCAGNIALLVGMGFVYRYSDTLIEYAYMAFMFLWVFGFQLIPIMRIKNSGVSFWRMRNMLNEMAKDRGGASVPCPDCLYPLCDLSEADKVHVCSECGCGIRGADAIRAWGRLEKRYVTPKAWSDWFFDEKNPGW